MIEWHLEPYGGRIGGPLLVWVGEVGREVEVEVRMLSLKKKEVEHF